MRSILSIIAVLVLFVPTLKATSPLTLAVLDFSNNSLVKKEDFSALSKGIAEMMITELSQVSSVIVVERQQLKSIVEEIQLSQSGLIDEQSQVKVGKIVGAQYLVLGSFMAAFGDKIRLDARVIHVETGQTIKAGKAEGKTKKILELISKLTRAILKNLDIKLSKTDRKQLDKNKNVSLEAVTWFSKGIDAEDRGDIKTAKKYYRKALKSDSKFTAAKRRLKKIAK